MNLYIPHNRRMPLQAEEALGSISIPRGSRAVLKAIWKWNAINSCYIIVCPFVIVILAHSIEFPAIYGF